MTEENEREAHPVTRIPTVEEDQMLAAALNWLNTASLSDDDREVITSQTADMAAKLSVFCNALVSSRASAAATSHTFLEFLKNSLMRPDNLAAISTNPHAIMELMKVLQRQLDSETKFLTDMTQPERIQNLQDARAKARKSKTPTAGSSEADEEAIADKIRELPAFSREKIRELFDSLDSDDKVEED